MPALKARIKPKLVRRTKLCVVRCCDAATMLRVFLIDGRIDDALHGRLVPAVTALGGPQTAFQLALLWHLYDDGAVRYQIGIRRSVRCVPICGVWR